MKHPCLFLFDGRAEGVREPALSTFTGALLRAISAADPRGEMVAELRGGLPVLADFAAQIGEVSSAPRQTSYTQTHDMRLYRLLLWDVATALGEGPGAPDSRVILNVLRRRREECLSLSDVPDHIRGACDVALETCPGYLGSCPIDTGNPILRQAFYERLGHLALISDGAIIQQRSEEGADHFEVEGAREFLPNGLRWIDHSLEEPTHDRFRPEKAPLSIRGALSVDRLKRKPRTTVEGRVFQALREASWTDLKGQTYSFATAENAHDILQAVLPDGKFTDYLFDRSHDEGGSKATFVIDELGFEPDDWRFLAAQFYDGLLLSQPRKLVIQRWENGYGARFNVFVEITSRVGKRGVMRTGWMLEPKKLPRLVTAVPARCEDGLVRPPTPPILAPGEGDTWWQSLFLLADEHGRAAHAATLPTPMILEDYGVIEEGECGSARVLIADAHGGFARWVVKTGRGNRGDRSGAEIYCNLPSQSIERAEAYALAFARVLALNGVPSRVETYYA